VPPDDHVALAKALNCLLGSRDRLARLGAGSAARADRYDAGSFVTALEHHYEEICA
jgi:glycosyltransferase involved in cell wall biosynthesis